MATSFDNKSSTLSLTQEFLRLNISPRASGYFSIDILSTSKIRTQVHLYSLIIVLQVFLFLTPVGDIKATFQMFAFYSNGGGGNYF